MKIWSDSDVALRLHVISNLLLMRRVIAFYFPFGKNMTGGPSHLLDIANSLDWADIVQEALQSPRPSATEAIAMVEDSSFNLDRVVGFYERLYQSEGSGTN